MTAIDPQRPPLEAEDAMPTEPVILYQHSTLALLHAQFPHSDQSGAPDLDADDFADEEHP